MASEGFSDWNPRSRTAFCSNSVRGRLNRVNGEYRTTRTCNNSTVSTGNLVLLRPNANSDFHFYATTITISYRLNILSISLPVPRSFSVSFSASNARRDTFKNGGGKKNKSNRKLTPGLPGDTPAAAATAVAKLRGAGCEPYKKRDARVTVQR